MPRIIAGQGRGLVLGVPNKGTRPTQDRVREAVFSALTTRGAIDQAVVLDLFAGSGALAFEALSRGAACADLVERANQAWRCLKQNAEKCKNLGVAKLHFEEAKHFLRGQNTIAAWDLVFIDPPYDYEVPDLLEVLTLLHPLCHRDAWVVVERSRREVPPQWPEEHWQLDGVKHYGETTVFYLRPALEPAG